VTLVLQYDIEQTFYNVDEWSSSLFYDTGPLKTYFIPLDTGEHDKLLVT